MRLKKGFTLAEILIVLMVIGVIATLTVPSMMKGVQDAQYKAAFKKAYNTVSNIYSMVAVEGAQPVPGAAIAKRGDSFLVNMLENLSIRDIVSGTFTDGTLPNSNSSIKVTYTLNGNSKTVGYSGGGGTDVTIDDTGKYANVWVTSDDGISYTIVESTTYNCQNKTDVNGAANTAAQIQASCLTVLADVNGASKRPNTPETQMDIAASATMDTLTGDQYYIYIARDGVTAGNKQQNVGARIIADVK